MSLSGYLNGNIVDTLVQILLGGCPVHVGCPGIPGFNLLDARSNTSPPKL